MQIFSSSALRATAAILATFLTCGTAPAQEAMLAEQAAALAAQYGKTAAMAARQAALVEARINATRSWRLRGGNANSSTLAINFTGEAPPEATDAERSARNAAFDTANRIAEEKRRRTMRYGVWFAGNVAVDAKRATEARLSTAHSDGMTFGADARLSPRLLVGNAVGFGFDRIGVGAAASQSSKSFSDTLYATVFTSQKSYFDTALGASTTRFTDVFASGAESTPRYANRAFAVMRYSRVIKHNALQLVPFGSASASYVAQLDSQGLGAGGLSCALLPQRTLAVTAGVRARATVPAPSGVFHPHADLSLSRKAESGFTAAVYRTFGAGQERVERSAAISSNFAASAGIDWTINKNATAKALYAVSANDAASGAAQSLTAGFTLRF